MNPTIITIIVMLVTEACWEVTLPHMLYRPGHEESRNKMGHHLGIPGPRFTALRRKQPPFCELYSWMFYLVRNARTWWDPRGHCAEVSRIFFLLSHKTNRWLRSGGGTAVEVGQEVAHLMTCARLLTNISSISTRAHVCTTHTHLHCDLARHENWPS